MDNVVVRKATGKDFENVYSLILEVIRQYKYCKNRLEKTIYRSLV